MTFIHVIDATPDRTQRSKPGVEPGTTWLQSQRVRLGTRIGAKGGISATWFALALAAPLLVGLLVPVGDLGTAFAPQTEVHSEVLP